MFYNFTKKIDTILFYGSNISSYPVLRVPSLLTMKLLTNPQILILNSCEKSSLKELKTIKHTPVLKQKRVVQENIFKCFFNAPSTLHLPNKFVKAVWDLISCRPIHSFKLLLCFFQLSLDVICSSPISRSIYP